MNCDCIKDIESKIAVFMRPKAGDDAEARILNTALMVTETSLVSVLQIPFRIKGSKKGYTSEKGKEMGCNASHCPFCGRTTGRYTVGADAGLDAVFPTQGETA
jgi:hypothetical protein